jgi:hypothetical protein
MSMTLQHVAMLFIVKLGNQIAHRVCASPNLFLTVYITEFLKIPVFTLL